MMALGRQVTVRASDTHSTVVSNDCIKRRSSQPDFIARRPRGSPANLQLHKCIAPRVCEARNRQESQAARDSNQKPGSYSSLKDEHLGPPHVRISTLNIFCSIVFRYELFRQGDGKHGTKDEG